MRRYSSYTGQYYGGYHANTMNVTNVTNITNVTIHKHTSGSRCGYGHHGRSPKYSLCRGVHEFANALSSNSRGRMLAGSVNSVAYSCRGLSHSVGGIASDLGRVGKSLCGIAVAIGDAIFGE